jgi:hypothetical protein
MIYLPCSIHEIELDLTKSGSVRLHLADTLGNTPSYTWEHFNA